MSQATSQSNFSIIVNLLYSIACYSKGKVPIQTKFRPFATERVGGSPAIFFEMENGNEFHEMAGGERGCG